MVGHAKKCVERYCELANKTTQQFYEVSTPYIDWKSMGKNAKLKEKQKWAEIHLDNARKLQGIYFIDPEDKEYKETIKNARKKLETSVGSCYAL